MARESAIEWCSATWNPWYGCDKVSPGCTNCYAERWTKFSGRTFEVTRAKGSFEAPLRWHTSERIFVCSLSDFFHKDADGWRKDAWDIIRWTTRHTYLLLTKRAGRLREVTERLQGWPLPHVWLGVSAEDQRRADERISLLLEANAAVRFVSCEPLLGPIDLKQGLDWVVVGGESGNGYRAIDPTWVTDLRDQCVQAGVSFFFKQWGGRTPKEGGRLLEGRTWSEDPTGC